MESKGTGGAYKGSWRELGGDGTVPYLGCGGSYVKLHV